MPHVFLEQSQSTLCFEPGTNSAVLATEPRYLPVSASSALGYYRRALQRPAVLLLNVDDKDPNSGP